jgi:hypothetical protein
MTDDKKPRPTDNAYALLEQAHKFMKIAPTIDAWEDSETDHTEEEVSSARAILAGATELRRVLWGLENAADEIIRRHNVAQDGRMEHFFADEG